MPVICPLNSGDCAMCCAHELVHAVGRVQQVAARSARGRCASVTNEKGTGRIVAALLVEAREVDARAMESRRRAGLQPAPAETERFQRLGQSSATAAHPRGRPAAAPADVHQAIQERAGRDDQRADSA